MTQGSSSSAVDEFLCCPECRTIQRWPEDRAGNLEACVHCQLKLTWINRLVEVREALSRLANGRQELRVHAWWPGGEVESPCSPDRSGQLMVGDYVVTIAWGNDGHTAKITLAGQSKTVTLPSEITFGDMRLQLRLIAVLRDASPPRRPISQPPNTDPQSIGEHNPLVIGRKTGEEGCQITVSDRDVDMRHCMIVREPDGERRCWLVDRGSSSGTFVNGKSNVTARLRSGDLIQVGPQAWQFSAADGFLVPVRPIRGVSLKLKDVTVGGQLKSLTCCIPAGQLTALVGSSGAGKSTLVETILGAWELTDGEILADGRDVAKNRQWFQRIACYVPQGWVVHEQLTAHAVVKFAMRFRGCYRKDRGREVLRAVDLPKTLWNKRLKLSGGEKRRVQTAAELVNEPRLLILDEPTSGLDAERERAILQLLKSMSRRGGTVLVVTHSGHLEIFDRIIRLKDGQLEVERELDTDIAAAVMPRSGDDGAGDQPEPVPKEPFPKRLRKLTVQTGTHIHREFELSRGDLFRRLVLPLVVLPLLFALCLFFAIQRSEDRDLLGFLSVLSCIWMGASLSLMSIVDEREIIDHERLIFLSIGSYLLAKAVVLFLYALFQVAVFLPILWLLYRIRDPQEMLYHRWECLGWLVLVTWAAVGVGLVLSALSGRSRPAANFMLPLVMIAQIVFSVEIAGNGNRDVAEAYNNFSLPLLTGNEHDAPVAALASYLTISRYGDMALRRFAYSEHPSANSGRFRWKAEAGIGLVLSILALPTFAGLWLEFWPRLARRRNKKLIAV